jgi:N-acyl-L-homoserine lactone synthetase
MSSEALVWTPSFTDRVQELLERVDYRLAETEEERESIFRLRYEAYLREGAIAPNTAGILTDHYDDTDNVWIFGVHIEGQLASSIRVHAASQQHPISPSVDVFADLLMPELALGKTVIDPTRFVADHEMARRHPELPYVTVRLGYLAGEFLSAEIGVASVRSEHKAFYRRLFGMSQSGEERRGPGLVKPVCLMKTNYASVRDQIVGRYPFMRSTVFERRMLFERRLASAGADGLPTARVLPAANDAVMLTS